MTEDWRRSLDKRESAMALAVDLSKAFDSVNHNLLLAKLKANVSLNLPWVWCHLMYWVVNRGFVCMVCAQRGFHRGPSSDHCCLIYLLMTWITWSRTCLWDYTLMTRLCMHHISRPLLCNLFWTRVSAAFRSGSILTIYWNDKQCQDTSPSNRSLQVWFWFIFKWFWSYQISRF